MNPAEGAPGDGAADNVVLIGPMGAGKSSVARELSALGRQHWVDTDRIVIQNAGMPITEIFATQGEECFRQMETAALRSLADKRQLIIATGGGIVTDPQNHALLHALGFVVWLTASEDILFARVSRTGKRPLLHTADPRATLHGLLERRHPLYAACAHHTIDTSERSHAQIAEAVFAQARAFFAARDPARI